MTRMFGREIAAGATFASEAKHVSAAGVQNSASRRTNLFISICVSGFYLSPFLLFCFSTQGGLRSPCRQTTSLSGNLLEASCSKRLRKLPGPWDGVQDAI